MLSLARHGRMPTLVVPAGGAQVTDNEEWENFFRIARIMARQNAMFTLPPTRKTPQHYERKANTKDKSRAANKEKGPPKHPKLKTHPFVSRSIRQRYIAQGIREFIYAREGGRCFYCHCDVPESGAHIDHVFPVSRGGKSTYENLVLSCAACNLSKNASVLENLNEILSEVKRRNRDFFG